MDRIEGVQPKQQCTAYQSFGSEEVGLPDISVNPAEQPKQLEAVIVIPIRELGYDTEVSIRSMLLKGITPDLAEEMRSRAPDFITIREKAAK
jgi:hypothetical protein